MQTTRLLQHNNPPQNQFPTSQVYIEFYKFLTRRSEERRVGKECVP